MPVGESFGLLLAEGSTLGVLCGIRFQGVWFLFFAGNSVGDISIRYCDDRGASTRVKN